jgi:gluconate 2-dehydrogenase gamma chain
MSPPSRREVLLGTAFVLIGDAAAKAGVLRGQLPWHPNAGSPPLPVMQDGWVFFTTEEGAAVEALADRLIPPDSNTPGGKDAGCAVYIDRQLIGPFGSSAGLYTRPPFVKGIPQQGSQSADPPAVIYRKSLAALDRYCRAQGAKAFAQLPPERQDQVVSGLEAGSVELEGADGKVFFEMLLKNVQEGFFADPIYGGNKDMCGWKMIGYPGAHYDYRDWVGRHNERYPHPPVSIAGRPEWTPKGT